MKPVTREDLPRVLDCLEKDLPRCLYLYADIWVYGLDNPHMKVWFQEDGEGVRKVAMEYHSSFQLWGDRDFGDTGDFLELIRSRAPRGISARREIVEALAPDLPDFTAEYGFVVEHRLPPAARLEARLAESGGAVCQAGEEDALEIAALICADPELGAQYTVEGLAAQLRERMATGMGRSFIIRREGRIAAHTATFAECPKFVVAGGLVVRPDCRDTPYFLWLDQAVSLAAVREGKARYGMVQDPRLLRAFQRAGDRVAAEYGKLIKKPREEAPGLQEKQGKR